MKISIVVSGRSYDQLAKLPSELELPAGATLDDALAALAQALPDDASLPASCLVAVGEDHLGTVGRHDSPELTDGQEVVILAPVAGG